MLFKDIPGKEQIKKQLVLSAQNNRVSHAQLFLGKNGSPNLTLAIAYAQYLNCKKRTNKDSCGECSSCVKHRSLSHPDLHLIFPVLKPASSKKVTSDDFVNQWREFILEKPYSSLNEWIDTFKKENKKGQQGSIYKDEIISIQQKLTLKNFEAKYKIVLFWMPEKMNIEASNKILKTLEEPPRDTVFLLVSQNIDRLLPTVRSRLQKTQIGVFNLDEIADFFADYSLDNDEIKKLNNIADSDVGKMMLILEEKSDSNDLFNSFSSWMRLIYKKENQYHNNRVASYSALGRKNQILFLSYTINKSSE